MKNQYEAEEWDKMGYLHPGQEQAARRLAELELQYRTVKEGCFLNVCCGSGQGMEWFRSYENRRYGVDKSFDLLEKALERQPELHWIQADVTGHLPFENEWASAVLCECCLSMFEEKKKFILEEIKRVLKKDGLLLVADLEWEERIEIASFSLLYEEQHPEWVKEFAARWLWENGTLPTCCQGKRKDKGLPGYFLAVYRR